MSVDLFSYGPGNIREFFKKNLVAILYTLIFHMLVAIILIVFKTEGLKNDMELGVMLDFTEEQSMEELLEEEMVDVPADWLEQVYAAREAASNRAVNLQDEVNSDISTEEYVQELLDELESVKDPEFLKDREKWEEIISSYVYDDAPLPEENEDVNEEPFTGPTTITYEFLDAPPDRDKIHLTIPVYRCEGAALVAVLIEVARDGSVVEAKIEGESNEVSDCFSEAAREAARTSRFRSDFSAPERQRARITYQFIAQ